MAQDSSNKLVTVGNLATFKQRLDALYSTQQSVTDALEQFTHDFVGNSSNPINCSTLGLSGLGTVSITEVTPQGAPAYNALHIVCGGNITDIPISGDNTIATANEVNGKADRITIEYSNSSYSFSTTPCIGTFYTRYFVSGNGVVVDQTQTEGGSSVPNINASANLAGKVVYIKDDSARSNIDGYRNAGFYLVTIASHNVISAATYICSVFDNGLYYGIAADKFFRKGTDGSLVEIRLSSTTIVDGDLSYDVAGESDIDAIFDIIDGGENNG